MILPVEPGRYATFLAAMAIMAATPGPSNLFAIANGMSRGRRAVALGILGMNTATLIWYAGATLGLSALARAYPQVVRVLIIVGAAYLIYLAARSLWTGFRGRAAALPKAEIHKRRSPYWDGFVVQMTNPKVLLFFGAVLPPFLDLSRPLPAQFAMFALASVLLDVIATTTYGFTGAALAARMSSPRFAKGFSIAIAVVLLAAAALILSRA